MASSFSRGLHKTQVVKEPDLIFVAVSFRTVAMQLYVGKNGQQLGPFPIEEVNRKLADGSFSGTDLAWYEGAAGWAPLSTIPGITLPAAPSAPVPTPTSTPTPAPAPAPAPVPKPVAPAAAPVQSTAPIARTPVAPGGYKTLSTVSWVLLGVTLVVSFIPFLGCGAWALGWPVAIAAIIMGIIVITRGGTGHGIMIILGGVLIIPLAFLAQFASLAVVGSFANKEDRKNETQIMENLRTVDGAKGKWASATNARDAAPVTMASLTSYLNGKEVKPVVGEQYDPMPVGQAPTATLPATTKSLGNFKGGDVLTVALLEADLAKPSFMSKDFWKSTPSPTATAKASPAATTGARPTSSPRPTISPRPSISPEPSETPSERPFSSTRPSPSAKFAPDGPKPRRSPAETPSSSAPESSGLKQGREFPRESPSPSPDDEDN